MLEAHRNTASAHIFPPQWPEEHMSQEDVDWNDAVLLEEASGYSVRTVDVWVRQDVIARHSCQTSLRQV